MWAWTDSECGVYVHKQTCVVTSAQAAQADMHVGVCRGCICVVCLCMHAWCTCVHMQCVWQAYDCTNVVSMCTCERVWL